MLNCNIFLFFVVLKEVYNNEERIDSQLENVVWFYPKPA